MTATPDTTPTQPDPPTTPTPAPPASPATPPVDSPPPAAAPEARDFDPRARLHQLALELTRAHNRRLMLEYLRLRRAAV